MKRLSKTKCRIYKSREQNFPRMTHTHQDHCENQDGIFKAHSLIESEFMKLLAEAKRILTQTQIHAFYNNLINDH